MAVINKLTATFCRKKHKRGLYNDGGGLYLRVAKSGTASWVFRYQHQGKTHEMGLGSLDTFNLDEVRERARRCRQQLKDGTDPLQAKREKRAAQRLEQHPSKTFEWCAEQVLKLKEPTWRNPKYPRNWRASLREYVFPMIGKLAVDLVGEQHVLQVLEPIWERIPVTAGRVRGRIEETLSWATAKRYRIGANPARWADNLEHHLPPIDKLNSVKHFAAVKHEDMPALVARLRADPADSVANAALQFVIYTAARSNEVLGAVWEEIEMEKRSWTVPATRMKGGAEHRVPLSTAAMAIIERMAARRQSDYVFPGLRNRPLPERAMRDCLRKHHPEATVHGFRSGFDTWASEKTHFPPEVVNLALAHKVSDKVEKAYRRTDQFDRRRRLAELWSQYLSGQAWQHEPEAVVVPMRQAG